MSGAFQLLAWELGGKAARQSRFLVTSSMRRCDVESYKRTAQIYLTKAVSVALRSLVLRLSTSLLSRAILLDLHAEVGAFAWSSSSVVGDEKRCKTFGALC